MESYNVMVTQANTKLGFEFLKQLVDLPYPPKYVFASYTGEDTFKELLQIKESSKQSKLVIIKMDCQIFEDICEAKEMIQQVTGNQGLKFLINIISFTNGEENEISFKRLERQFQAYTVSQLSLFQAMSPLLVASPRREGSKPVYFNITEDNSVGSDAIFEINKIALNLSIYEATFMNSKVLQKHILFLGTCLNTKEISENDVETVIENCVRSMLLYTFCSSQCKIEASHQKYNSEIVNEAK